MNRAAAGFLVVALAAWLPASAGAASDGLPTPAAGEPRLPDAPPPVPPLRRDANGALEIIDPATIQRTGAAVCQPDSLCVGPHQRFATLAAALADAHDGSVLEIVGVTYRESATIGLNNVVLRGVAGRPHFDCSHAKLAGGRACLLLVGDGITLDNVEISGAEGACVANEAGKSFTLSHVICHGSMNGLVARGGAIVVEDSEFYDNGWTPQSSNIALDGACDATIRGTVIRDARAGSELISRCVHTMITDSTLRSLDGGVDLDFPDGGQTTVYRTSIEKRRSAADLDILRFATESCLHPGGLELKEVRIIDAQADAAIRNGDRCDNRAIVLDDLTVQGPLPRLLGFVMGQIRPAAVARTQEPPNQESRSQGCGGALYCPPK